MRGPVSIGAAVGQLMKPTAAVTTAARTRTELLDTSEIAALAWDYYVETKNHLGHEGKQEDLCGEGYTARPTRERCSTRGQSISFHDER